MPSGTASIAIAEISLLVAVILLVLAKGHSLLRIILGVFCLLSAMLFSFFSFIRQPVAANMPNSTQSQSFQSRSKVIELAEPTIYWKGARVPISQIHDPDVCPVCGYFLAIGGRILDYTVNAETDQVTEVFLSEGEIKGYSWNGDELKIPFKVSIGRQQGNWGGDKQIAELLTGKNQIKGLFLEGDVLKGLIVYSRDLSKEQLPKKTPLGPHIRVDLNLTGAAAAGNANPITVTGTGFNRQYPVEVLLDGRIVQQEQPVKFDGKGNFTVSIPPSLDIGGHTVLIRQKLTKAYYPGRQHVHHNCAG
jgi:hypothetical protein